MDCRRRAGVQPSDPPPPSNEAGLRKGGLEFANLGFEGLARLLTEQLDQPDLRGLDSNPAKEDTDELRGPFETDVKTCCHLVGDILSHLMTISR
jgi:hypothetical protein